MRGCQSHLTTEKTIILFRIEGDAFNKREATMNMLQICKKITGLIKQSQGSF